jgi:predicted DNA-binding helix-hairpin-helix protein
MATRCLSTRELNALRVALDKRHISVDDVATLDYVRLIRVPGLGRKSIANIRAWLAEQGRSLCNDRSDEHAASEVDEETRNIRRAISYLHEHGYTVLPPRA